MSTGTRPPAALEGDPTGATVTYASLIGGRLAASPDLRRLVRQPGQPAPELDETALAHLLHDGFVPFPRTVFKNVHALGIGDRLERDGPHGLTLTVDFPYLRDRSAEDQVPDPDRLLRLLSASLERVMAPHAAATLMLSSGLDSVPLGLAAATIGRAADVAALTFDQHGSGEGEAAGTFARRFGIRHAALGWPRDRRKATAMVLEHLAAAEQPCCDPVALAYAVTLRQAGAHGTLVLDGSGNDVYLGEIPTRRALLLDRLHLLPGAWLAPLRAAAPFWSPLNKVASSRSEKTFVEEYYLRHRETRRFFGGSVDTSALWRREDRRGAGLRFADFNALVGSRHQDANSIMLKGRLAAAGVGAAAGFPWCDPDVIAYCFNLPDAQRRGRVGGENKPLVRAMLRRHADYDAVTQHRKVVFSFFLSEFLRTNQTLVDHEIRSCRLWARSALDTLPTLWRVVEERAGTAVALHALFSVSAWLNHATILQHRAGEPASDGPSLAAA